jgi:hypothetical protein
MPQEQPADRNPQSCKVSLGNFKEADYIHIREAVQFGHVATLPPEAGFGMSPAHPVVQQRNRGTLAFALAKNGSADVFTR